MRSATSIVTVLLFGCGADPPAATDATDASSTTASMTTGTPTPDPTTSDTPTTDTPTTDTPTSPGITTSTSNEVTTDNNNNTNTDTTSTTPDETTTTTTTTNTDTTASDTTTTTTDTTASDTTASDTTTTTTDTTGMGELCGNGELDPDETCDDANAINDDECSNSCQSAACGDSIIQAALGETCDDGANNGDDQACTLACALATCGDGLLYAGMEDCDDGNNVDTDFCDNDCNQATCSDAQQNGAETSIDCGGPTCDKCPFLLLLAGNTNQTLAGHYAAGTWKLDDIAAPTVDGLDVAITDTGLGVGLLRFTKLNDPKDNQLQYVTWQSGTWSAPTQVGNDTTRAAPTIYAAGTSAYAGFHGENYQHYHAVFTANVWSPTAEAVGSFGPGPGSLLRLGGDPLLVFHDGAADNVLKARRRTNAWMPWQTIDSDTAAFDRQPATAALTGDKAILVHARNSGQLRSSRCDGPCAAMVDVPGALTSAPPALTALQNAAAALAFRGQDGRLYVSVHDGLAWGAATAVLANNAQIYGAPAITAGITGAEIELVYLDAATRHPRHVRRIAGVWTAPSNLDDLARERITLERSPFGT